MATSVQSGFGVAINETSWNHERREGRRRNGLVEGGTKLCWPKCGKKPVLFKTPEMVFWKQHGKRKRT